MRLLRVLADARPADLCVVPEPALQLGPQTEFDPDLIVDPDLARPELTVFELRDGRYAAEAQTAAPLTVTRPFAVTIIPARLTAGIRR